MFQPTHPHGVRQIPALRSKCTKWFQPTHPHGVRLPEHFPFSASHIVSTHAPARGATINVKKIEVVILVSTHAPARGATVQSARHRRMATVSTHAPARGATPRPWWISSWSGFNPRTRTGCDARRLSTLRRAFRFNPRTRTGCDLAGGGHMPNGRTFQPTHPHGVRLHSIRSLRAGCSGFNPRTRTGCDA